MAEIDTTRESSRSSLSAAVPLAPNHDFEVFDCGKPALNHWLRHRARKNESRFLRTYAACHGTSVAGFYSLSAGAVERAAAPGKLRRNAPESIPVSIIGRLAVCQTYAGQGLGSSLLADALRRIITASKSIGIGAVLVHAKDENAKQFYLHQAEFTEYPADSRTLYLPIDTLIAAFG